MVVSEEPVPRCLCATACFQNITRCAHRQLQGNPPAGPCAAGPCGLAGGSVHLSTVCSGPAWRGGGWIGWWRPRRKAVCLPCKRRRTADDMVRSRRPCPRCFGNNVSSRERVLGLLYHAQSRSLGTGAFVVDKSSSIVVRLDMRARPVACVSGAIDETLASFCWPAPPHAQQFQVFFFRALLPLPPPPSPMGQRPTTGSRLLPPRSRPRSRTTPQPVGGALGTEVFQRRPRQVRICSTRVQGPGTTIGRFPIIGSSVRHSFRTGRIGTLALGSSLFLGGRTSNRVGRTNWTGGERREQRTTERACFKCFSSSDEARPCNGEGRGAGARFQHACRS